MELLQKEDLPNELQEFYCKKEVKYLPDNIATLHLFLPENCVDKKQSLFKDYMKQNNKKIVDEVHFSFEGLGFLEKKDNEFNLKDIKKFQDFKGYFEKRYKQYQKLSSLKYCIIQAKKLGGLKSKELNMSKDNKLYYRNHPKRKLYSIGKTNGQKVIPTYLIKKY